VGSKRLNWLADSAIGFDILLETGGLFDIDISSKCRAHPHEESMAVAPLSSNRYKVAASDPQRASRFL